MRKLGLLLAAMLLIALLPQPAKAAEQSVYIVQRKPFDGDDETTFSASRSGSIELDGGWGGFRRVPGCAGGGRSHLEGARDGPRSGLRDQRDV